MLEFKQIDIEDKRRLQPLLMAEKDRGCEYTFGNLFIWRDTYHAQYAEVNGGVVLRFDSPGAYLVPVGDVDIGDTVAQMMAYSEARGERFMMFSASESDCAAIDAALPGALTHHVNRDFGEYVYHADDLINLPGKNYQKKRNHVSRFLRDNPDYVFNPITAENIERVREMNNRWCKSYGCSEDNGLRAEHCAVEAAINHFCALDFSGGVIEAGGEIVAFAMGEPINDKTFCVHIEKAFHEINGAYAIINRDFAREFCKDYAYINREDDVGEEGLRKAKLSYFPAFVTEKYTIHKK